MVEDLTASQRRKGTYRENDNDCGFLKSHRLQKAQNLIIDYE
jgi:hypothetical protein